MPAVGFPGDGLPCDGFTCEGVPGEGVVPGVLKGSAGVPLLLPDSDSVVKRPSEPVLTVVATGVVSPWEGAVPPEIGEAAFGLGVMPLLDGEAADGPEGVPPCPGIGEGESLPAAGEGVSGTEVMKDPSGSV